MQKISASRIQRVVEGYNMAILLDGQSAAKEISKEIATEVQVLWGQGHTVCLAIILIGEDPSSRLYVRKKKELGETLGMRVDVFSDLEIPGIKITEQIPKDALLSPENLHSYISKLLERRKDIGGIIVQLPIPREVRTAEDGTNQTQKILDAIPLEKDVDLLSQRSIDTLKRDRSPILPPTLAGILKLLEKYNIPFRGKRVLFVGHGPLVGKPGAVLFRNRGAKVTVLEKIDKEKRPKYYERQLKKAWIIISGVGEPGVIRGDMVGEGQVIIDAGSGKHRRTGEVVGDIDFESVEPKAAFITPVPGGVGPMTVAMLLWNTWYLTKLHLP